MLEARKMIIASTSTTYGTGYLEYLLTELEELYRENNTVVFVPFARPGGITHDEYTKIVSKPFRNLGKKVIGLHTYKDGAGLLEQEGAVFTGGGNTFLLVRELHQRGLMEVLRSRVLDGLPYAGTSAGANITGPTMQTTNDMPIVYPPSFETLGCISFNINPHYRDPIPGSTHMGESRETRIAEFHRCNQIPVLGLREGSWLRVNGRHTELKGEYSARLFRPGEIPAEVPPGILEVGI